MMGGHQHAACIADSTNRVRHFDQSEFLLQWPYTRSCFDRLSTGLENAARPRMPGRASKSCLQKSATTSSTKYPQRAPVTTPTIGEVSMMMRRCARLVAV